MLRKNDRKSIRLKGYNYSREGLYFITMNCVNQTCLFGSVKEGKLKLNDAGKHTNKCWLEIPIHFPNVILHEYVIMPNHVHGIIEISKTEAGTFSKTIGSIVRGFKIGVTKWYRTHHPEKYPVGKSVWQRNYYDVIIRNEKSYHNISEYIKNNPKKWEHNNDRQ